MQKSNSFGQQIPVFNGVKGISIMLVVVSHIQGMKHYIPGTLGVTLFFFISGFLITRLLIQEFDKKAGIAILKFYLRRLVRIYPPLLIMLVFGSLFLMSLGLKPLKDEIIAGTFYLENYYFAYFSDNLLYFQQLWSIAVEEHFYLIYPILFTFLYPKQKIFISTLVFIMLVAPIFRGYYTLTYGTNKVGYLITYATTECRIDSILYGCLSSFLFYKFEQIKYLWTNKSRLAYLGFFLLALSLLIRHPYFIQIYKFSMQGIAISLFLPSLLVNPKLSYLRAFFENKWLILAGKYSYSLYLFHWFGFHIAKRTTSTIWENATVSLLCTGLFAYISYKCVELPFIYLRKKLGSTAKA